jgi:exosortase K
MFRHTHIKLFAVLLSAYALKLHYSVASANQLRWILAPTTFLIELVSGRQFAFESHAGYMSDDHTFLIAASCAGINFLITAFLMLALRRLWRDRSKGISWSFLPASVLMAYIATLLANTIRISIALQLQRNPLDIAWLDPDQFHRLEGICVYFGFLMLLYVITERFHFQERLKAAECNETSAHSRLCEIFQRTLPALFPVLIYYATTLGFPLLNGASRQGTDFWEHSLFVLLTPLLLVTPLILFRLAVSAQRHLPGSE